MLDYSIINYTKCVYCLSKNVFFEDKDMSCPLNKTPYVQRRVFCENCNKSFKFHEISIEVYPNNRFKNIKEISEEFKLNIIDIFKKKSFIYNDVSYIKKGIAKENFNFVKNYILSSKDIFSYKEDLENIKKMIKYIKKEYAIDFEYMVFEHRLGYSENKYFSKEWLRKVQFLDNMK